MDFMSEVVKIFNDIGLGKQIQEERKRKGLSLEELGDMIDVSRQTLSRWEKGEGVGPTTFELLKLCKIFECDYGFLVGEYDCRTREATDIQNATGLSEKAIERLIFLHLLNDEETISFISALIIDPYFATAIQDFNLAKSFENGCKARDIYKKGLRDSLEKTEMKQDAQIDYLKSFHDLADYSIMAEHRADKIELSPDNMAKFYFIVARDYFLKAIDYIWEGEQKRYGVD